MNLEKAVSGTISAFAACITGGFYLNIEPGREPLARYGLAVIPAIYALVKQWRLRRGGLRVMTLTRPDDWPGC